MSQTIERKMVITGMEVEERMYASDGLPYVNAVIIHCEGSHDSLDFRTIFPEHYPIGSTINVSVSVEKKD